MLCAITKVGRFTASITLAIVNVLPLPVTPKSTCVRSPQRTPSVKDAIAWGWSPVGLYLECKINFLSSINNLKFFFIIIHERMFVVNVFNRNIG